MYLFSPAWRGEGVFLSFIYFLSSLVNSLRALQAKLAMYLFRPLYSFLCLTFFTKKVSGAPVGGPGKTPVGGLARAGGRAGRRPRRGPREPKMSEKAGILPEKSIPYSCTRITFFERLLSKSVFNPNTNFFKVAFWVSS